MDTLSIITVLIIDTGVLSFPGATVHYTDSHVQLFHGTQVAMLATGVVQNKKLCDNVQFYTCNWYPYDLWTCLDYANRNHFDFVNLSIEGNEKDIPEAAYLKGITDYGTIVTVSAGNQKVADLSSDKHYPPSLLYEGYINYRVVTDNNYAFANKGPGLIQDKAAWVLPNGKGSFFTQYGTSYAAPNYLNKLLVAYCAELKGKDNQCRRMN